MSFSGNLTQFSTSAFQSETQPVTPVPTQSVNNTRSFSAAFNEPSKYPFIFLNESLEIHPFISTANRSSLKISSVDYLTTPNQAKIFEYSTPSSISLAKVFVDISNISQSNNSYPFGNISNSTERNASLSIEQKPYQSLHAQKVRSKHVHPESVDFIQTIKAPEWSYESLKSSGSIGDANLTSDSKEPSTKVDTIAYNNQRSGSKWVKKLARDASVQANDWGFKYDHLDHNMTSRQTNHNEGSTIDLVGDNEISQNMSNDADLTLNNHQAINSEFIHEKNNKILLQNGKIVHHKRGSREQHLQNKRSNHFTHNNLNDYNNSGKTGNEQTEQKENSMIESEQHQRNSSTQHVQDKKDREISHNNHYYNTSEGDNKQKENSTQKGEITQNPSSKTVMYFIHAVFNPLLPPTLRPLSNFNTRSQRKPNLNQVREYTPVSYPDFREQLSNVPILNSLLSSNPLERSQAALQTQENLRSFDYMDKHNTASHATSDSSNFWSNQALDFMNSEASGLKANKGYWPGAKPKLTNDNMILSEMPFVTDESELENKPEGNLPGDRSYITMLADRDPINVWPLWRARPWSTKVVNKDPRRTVFTDPSSGFVMDNSLVRETPNFMLTSIDSAKHRLPLNGELGHLPWWRAIFQRGRSLDQPMSNPVWPSKISEDDSLNKENRDLYKYWIALSKKGIHGQRLGGNRNVPSQRLNDVLFSRAANDVTVSGDFTYPRGPFNGDMPASRVDSLKQSDSGFGKNLQTLASPNYNSIVERDSPKLRKSFLNKERHVLEKPVLGDRRRGLSSTSLRRDVIPVDLTNQEIGTNPNAQMESPSYESTKSLVPSNQNHRRQYTSPQKWLISSRLRPEVMDVRPGREYFLLARLQERKDPYPIRTTLSSPSRQAPGSASQDFRCPRLFGYYPDPADCQSFFACSWGVAYRVTCPQDSLFNERKAVCDWAINVTCPDQYAQSGDISV
ncbi:hypothetical protein EGW08_007586 [Elysia chlorotica]|uniref:Chitin-binding type-2 domain-containing protein n=1 Tax=Elysia chlorotica TaxID=188477 RepID=A0A433TT32_ELYCH|nr:hypothetical protein EGW08_007586 [Elysia chlorotica]